MSEINKKSPEGARIEPFPGSYPLNLLQKETSMTHYTPSAVAMLTAFFATDTIEQTAQRTGFVKRRSKISGKVFLALVTFGLGAMPKQHFYS
jgi:hypothetical protein